MVCLLYDYSRSDFGTINFERVSEIGMDFSIILVPIRAKQANFSRGFRLLLPHLIKRVTLRPFSRVSSIREINSGRIRIGRGIRDPSLGTGPSILVINHV